MAIPVVTGNTNEILEKTEKKLRDYLNQKLFNKDPDYWVGDKDLISSDIVGNVRKRVKEYIDRNPTKKFRSVNAKFSSNIPLTVSS